MDLQIDEIFSDLYKDNEGIYVSDKIEKVNYRDGGHKFIEEVESSSFWYNHRNSVLVDLIKSQNCEWLLDLGGGNGATSIKLKNNGVKTIVFEPGRDGVLNAKKNGINFIIQADFMNCSVKPGAIENIGCFDVLEHIEDDKAFIRKIAKSLKVDGLLFITVPAFNSLWSRNDDDVGHFRRYTLKDLKELLSKEGFKVGYKTYLFWFLPIPIFIFRKFLYKKKLEKKKHFEHASNNGFANKLLTLLLKLERTLVNRRKKILFGSTCLIIAQKR